MEYDEIIPVRILDIQVEPCPVPIGEPKTRCIFESATIRNGTVLYFDKSLLDSGEASPSDSFSPPPCPAQQNPRDFREEA